MKPAKLLRVPVLLVAWGLLLAFGLAPGRARASEYKPLPPAAPVALSSDWLIHDEARNRLIFYLPGYHQPVHAYYQWVRLGHSQSFPLTFTAQPGLSLFIDNQLIFTARTATTYALDLGRLLPARFSTGQHLLAVWQPNGSPALASFSSGVSPALATPGRSVNQTSQALPRLPGPQGQNAYLSFLLLLGLSYGAVRATYPAGLARIFQIDELFGNGSDQQAFLAKPAFSLLNLLLVVLFALSFALLLTAIHTDLQSLPLLRRFVDVPDTAIVARVLLYTGVITFFIFSKYVYVGVLAYIFGLQPLVNLQYREFLRSTLLTGLFLPVAVLLYLGLNTAMPQAVAWVANAAIGLVLVGTVLRVTSTMHRSASLMNLHLFAYLCASEILPLLVLLKLIVFTY